MRTEILWEVTENSDKTEGRGYSKTVCYTKDRKVALEIVTSDIYAKQHGIMGIKGGKYDLKKKIINVVDSFEEFEKLSSDDIKKQALAKLTVEEKVALGLA